MILADKITKLRKKSGWSQEELAEKMNVSRQSVSKWESASSIPDLNKILMLSKIFGVSTDYLVKEEIEDVDEIAEEDNSGPRKVTLEETMLYIQNKRAVSRLISKGVLLCIFAITPLLFLLALSEQSYFNMTSNVAAVVGLIFLFIIIGIGIVFFVRINYYSTDLEKLEATRFELEYGVRGILNEKIIKYRPEYLKRITVGIILILTSCLPLITVGTLIDSGTLTLFMAIVLLLMVGLGTYVIIPTTIFFNALNFMAGEGEFAPHKRKHRKQTEKLAALYWPLVTALYLGWSLWTMAWGITWIVWPVAFIGFGALIGLFRIFESNETE